MSVFDIKKLDEINAMTLTEFYYRLHAQSFIELKQENDRVRLAFLIRNAQATKNVGTDKSPKEVYVYQEPNELFDYEKAYDCLLKGKEYNPVKANMRPNQDKLLALISDFNNK